MNVKANILGIALAVAFALPAAAQTVTLKSGAVRGSTEGEVTVFMGIPFAAAPRGDLRWRAPQPVKRWDGVRDAIWRRLRSGSHAVCRAAQSRGHVRRLPVHQCLAPGQHHTRQETAGDGLDLWRWFRVRQWSAAVL